MVATSTVLAGAWWVAAGLCASDSTATATSSAVRAQFTVPESADVGQNLLPWINDPEAIDPQAVCPGYIATAVTSSGGHHHDSHGRDANTTASGVGATFSAYLDLAGEPCHVYGNDVEHLVLTLELQAVDRVRVNIAPRYIGAQNASWFELPEVLVPTPSGTYSPPAATSSRAVRHHAASGDAAAGGSLTQSDLAFSWSNSPTFGFALTRISTGDVLFSTNGTKLVYEDQFIEFVSPLPENYNLYGLGEVIHGFRLGNNLTRTIFAADAGDPIDGNIYGSHPFYLDTRYFDKATGKYAANATAGCSSSPTAYESYTHGVFLRNAHPQEVLLRESNITWRALGGEIDLYFYAGPSAPDVMQSYQQTTVGLPALQQYFAFGYHQSRWGYENWTVLQGVVDNFKAADIPLETIWTDIDYMNQYRDFDNDQTRFGYAEGADFLRRLHTNGQHYVPIVDSAIYVPNPSNKSDAYPVFDRGVAADAFLLNPNGSLYIGQVWPGYTVFPDWIGAVLNGSGAFGWWTNEVVNWHKNVSFDGIWIDMSEVSSFCVGSCGSNNLTLNPVHPSFLLPGEPNNLITQFPEGFNITNSTEASSASSVASSQAAATSTPASPSTSTTYLRTTATPGTRNVNYPPYVINNVQGDLAVHAVSPNATHHGGVLEYDTHNLYGHQILNATYNALLSVFPGKRPFIIGRSTFAGSGKWAGHWGGDNTSLWAYMVFSIAQALSFSVFGVPMFGVDTCGFNGNSDMELCARWMQLSAFFPFYRNHNTLSAISQEPYVWAAVADASRTAMAIRYSLLPYMYTLFADAHDTGAPVMRALAWEFPTEPWLASADLQFMLGPALLVTPCLEQGATTVNGVFPGGSSSGSGSSGSSSGSASDTLWYDWYNQTAVNSSWVAPGNNVTIDAPLGHIPVFVRGGHVLPMQKPGMTTAESRANDWNLLVALDAKGGAVGKLYLDDGESVHPNATTWVHFAASSGQLTATSTGNYTSSGSSSGSGSAPALANVTIMGVACQPSNVSWNGTALKNTQWTYGKSTQLLQVTGLQDSTSAGIWDGKWNLSWA
ncbi:alpha-glucosidase [Sporothrix schenckii 1099-18]|uniref:alpha-glucosidase n=1 Tax=Sporothrix schenckii 1099-18 TaxID=1397361 RepID=A0A0F2LTS7_SPOSC|nr:alpha-glucosidase [Sporothrix schenckii 1099-18]KJR80878.1 alpha-glucosidase [Sporothrix schenckii 1099-18]